MARSRSLAGTDRFVEQIALLLCADGMPRIAGRLYGLLLVSAKPLSLDDLARQLGVSKASISVNVRLLEEKGVVEQIGRQGDRRDYYSIADDILERMLEQRIAKVRRIQQAIAEARANVTFEHEVVRKRLQNLDLAHNHLLDATSRTLDEWRARRVRRPTQSTSRSR